jgi:hypothetical protein
MQSLNRYWIILMLIGIGMLLIVAGWEVYQIASGNRSEVNVTVSELENNTLIPKNLEQHFLTDPDFTNISDNDESVGD